MKPIYLCHTNCPTRVGGNQRVTPTHLLQAQSIGMVKLGSRCFDVIDIHENDQGIQIESEEMREINPSAPSGLGKRQRSDEMQCQTIA